MFANSLLLVEMELKAGAHETRLRREGKANGYLSFGTVSVLVSSDHSR